MRIDWFLPAIRKTSDGLPAHRPWLASRLRGCLPASLVSNHQTKRRGLIRKSLRWLGTSWLQSPIRRFSQTICFAAFLWLFFFVCWPYTATPSPPTRSAGAWRLEKLDQLSGKLHLHHGGPPAWVEVGTRVYLVDEAINQSVGLFEVLAAARGQVVLRPQEATPEVIQSVVLASGNWSVADRDPNAWPSHYADDLAQKEAVPADVFLVLDPLVSLSTAIASRQWVWSLVCAIAILLICVIVPRGFCGYICPLGTLIDVFDWAISRRITRFRLATEGWWVHVKYYLLLGCLLCAGFGVLTTGYVAAIPVITRGLLFVAEPIQSGILRGWHLVPALTSGAIISMAMFGAVLALGLLQPRFWCKYVCPSGAVFSVANLFRATERKVESSCIHCNKCIEVCPFDAIKPDFTTRVTDCTQCQTCGGVCPTHAIKFVDRGNVIALKRPNDPPTGETSLGRRGFLSAAVGTVASCVGAVALSAATKTFGARLETSSDRLPIRPPGSVPEQEFLEMCIRCGECFKACPNNVLQPLAFEQGIEGLWTPQVVADWAGCESSCNACGQVCPTGAIRALPLDEKRHVRMGLAILNEQTCLPFADRESCQLCVDECNAAGYEAIEFTQVHTKVDESGRPMEGTGYLAPVVIADKCVGCGLCQTRCYGINVQQKDLLDESAIIIKAGAGREDRLLPGSHAKRNVDQQRREPDDIVPSSPKPVDSAIETETDEVSDALEDDPFGLN